MKKLILTVLAVLCVQFVGFTQKTETEEDVPQKKERDSNTLEEQMQKMQRDMFKMFGGGNSDSSGVFSFKFGSPNRQMDTTFSKSFGGIFDGQQWKSIMPGDSTMGDMMRQLQDNMPDFGKNFDMSEMFKSFGKMFGNDMDNIPQIEPKQKQRLGEGDKKEKKYKTESL